MYRWRLGLSAAGLADVDCRQHTVRSPCLSVDDRQWSSTRLRLSVCLFARSLVLNGLAAARFFMASPA